MAEFSLLLADPKLRDVFATVSREKVMKVDDLVVPGESTEDRSTTRNLVRQLQDAKLVDVKQSIFPEFNVVYVTADGLEASRKLGRERL